MTQMSAVSVAVLLSLAGAGTIPGYAIFQPHVGKIHYQNCQVTPSHIPVYTGDIVFWAFEETTSNDETVDVKFDKPEGSPCTNGASFTISKTSSGYCVIDSSAKPRP